jgi:hypothetical protein
MKKENSKRNIFICEFLSKVHRKLFLLQSSENMKSESESRVREADYKKGSEAENTNKSRNLLSQINCYGDNEEEKL